MSRPPDASRIASNPRLSENAHVDLRFLIPLTMLALMWLMNGCSRQQSAQPQALTNAPASFTSAISDDGVLPRVGQVANYAGSQEPKPSDLPPPRRHRDITFNREIAPVIYKHCLPCHRPNQSAPFTLLSYKDVQKHALDILKVTKRRDMPPWLPEAGYGEFANERRLSTDEIKLIEQWIEEGAVEGDPADLPELPKWTEEWQLGKPDLVLQLPQPYMLGPEGHDVYRNFVIPIPVNERRYVQAVEFRPGNKSVHHVRILIDQTDQSRRLDEQDTEPGFKGMSTPAKFPSGHMLTWTPGAVPAREPEGLPWVLERETDLVLQIHMQRTGKTEMVQPTIGIYFTNRPPAKAAFLIGLLSQLIDIPPGEKNALVERTFKLPVDVQVLGVMPHLHYLGKEVRGFATLPDGAKKWLIFIKHWDFNWQGEFRYTKPVFLPKGSILTMRNTYDNSAENLRNPNHPPRRVIFGPQSTDEMGELWLQVLPGTKDDLVLLEREQKLMISRETAAFYENFLRAHPDDAPSHMELGKVLGPLGQTAAAAQHLQTALRLDPNRSEAHYLLGIVFFNEEHYPQARAEFESELRFNPNYYKAHVRLGMICIEEQDLGQAEAHLRAAVRINPKDSMAQEILARILKAQAESKP